MQRKIACFVVLFLLVALFQLPAFSQSITSGDIAGVITDPSGAVVPNAKVTATSDNTGVSHSTTTNGEGFYRFSFLQPGPYTVSVTAAGFKTAPHKFQVAVGQAANGNIALAVSEAATTTVEVTAPPLQMDNADVSTNFSQQQIALVPNPGNDLSAIAQTSPGAVMNTQSGFGNFSSFGLPGTSNLFTLDGQNDNDPFLNLNNSGATNLLLGQNDVQEATVTTNGYSGQYGQLAGAQVNYVTKSGTNGFHGNLQYFWNGRTMNANDYINNLQVGGNPSTPRAFDNVNQWAIGFGGPIKKDKTFFFFDYEGLRIVLPTANTVRIPTPALETLTFQNLTANGLTASIPFYQNMFTLYNGTPGAANGVPGPCTNFTPPTGFDPNDCALTVRNTSSNFTHEYQVSLKIDHKFSEKDSMFVRAQNDHGLQATATDPINPIFNTQSDQPEYQGQISETHTFTPNVINEFKGSVLWYSAFFANKNTSATLNTFPTTVDFFGGDFSGLGGIDFFFPQGRNVTQGQIVDDLSINHGKHTFRLGANYRRYDVTDFDYGVFTSGLAVTTVDTFINGGTDFFQQNFPTRLSQPIALYGLGLYGQDEWRVNNKLRLTLSLRVDHNSNPVCQTNCFSELTQPFTSLKHDPSIPYNQVFRTGLHQAYPSTDGIVWQPRLGFAFSPFNNNKTVVRGGIGIFGDSFPAVLVDNFSSNPPVLNSFVTFGNLSPAETNGGNVFASTAGANAGFASAFGQGASFNDLTNPASPFFNPLFSPPAITASDRNIRQPRYQEWNLEVQQDVGWNTVLSINYVGNHGIFEPVQNNGLNAWWPSGPTLPAGLAAALGTPNNPFPNGFGGLPTSVPDARFGVVNQIQSIAVSNYNGLVTSLRHQFNRGFAFQLNYTWSHALDEVSNGGLLPFNDTTNVSPLNLFNPFNVRANYGNADYDVRHYFSANYVWDNALRHLFRAGPNAIFSGWTFSGTVFSRSGLPFSVVDTGTSGLLSLTNFGGQVFANIVGPTTSGSCGRSNATPDPTTGIAPSCLNTAGFASPDSLAFNQARNQFRGPHYFDTDFTVMKNNKLGEKMTLGFGVQFFNLFNHPNFDQPINDIASTQFGTIIRTVNTPTSILGSFLGGDASPRLIQLKAELKF